MPISITKEVLHEELKKTFGFSQFRGEQEAIIQNTLQGHNSFVLMPTGAGKSLCYQLPAIVMPGTAIVISPLIALMKNQVDQLVAFGVNAQFCLRKDLVPWKCRKTRRKGFYFTAQTTNQEGNIANH